MLMYASFVVPLPYRGVPATITPCYVPSLLLLWRRTLEDALIILAGAHCVRRQASLVPRTSLADILVEHGSNETRLLCGLLAERCAALSIHGVLRVTLVAGEVAEHAAA